MINLALIAKLLTLAGAIATAVAILVILKMINYGDTSPAAFMILGVVVVAFVSCVVVLFW